MAAVLLNSFGIVIGSLLGILFRRYLLKEMMTRVEIALGYCVIILGIKMSLEHQNYFVLLAALGIGAALGYLMDIQGMIERASLWFQSKMTKAEDNQSFSLGFSTSSVIFCTGAMAIVGSIDAGINGHSDVLRAKAIIDGVLSIVFASLYGVGVAFSAIPVLIYQGAIAFGSSKLQFLAQQDVLAEIKGTGGVLLLMIGLSLARIKSVSVAQFLLAIPFVIIIMFILKHT